ncbi:MAG: universal stress protein [Chthonomonadales bacterium]
MPLDGSRLAEVVLPAAISIALRFRCTVTLLHVLEQRPPATVHGDRHLMDAAGAKSYLEEVGAHMQAQGVSVEWHVHDNPEGDVAAAIVRHSEEFHPDLVVLGAHGRGGLRDLLFGSIAMQVLRKGARPVLLIQPLPDGSAPQFQLRRILVPLDARHPHGEVVALAVKLAGGFHAAIHLVFVVPTLETLPKERAAAATLLPATMRAMLSLDCEIAHEYLEWVAADARKSGCAVSVEVLRGDTVPEIVGIAERMDADLVAMSGHGRSKLDAMFWGGVASRVSTRTGRPLLFVPVGPED